MANVVLSNTINKVVGTRPIRHDGADKVTGRAKYGGDVHMTGLLFGQVLRSPYAHAQIKSIDVGKALAYPGVRAVITANDMPLTQMADVDRSKRFASDNLMAQTKALYKGHAIAAVAASSQHIADIAAGLIEVQYDVLPPMIDVRAAMENGATLLHDELTTTELGEKTDNVSNIAAHIRHEVGDVKEGFAAADVIVEREFRTATVHQGYIEPQNATA